jgi:hypothetical protein
MYYSAARHAAIYSRFAHGAESSQLWSRRELLIWMNRVLLAHIQTLFDLFLKRYPYRTPSALRS